MKNVHLLLRAIIEDRLNEVVHKISPLPLGYNSKLFRVDSKNKSYIAKVYHLSHKNHHRLGAEFRAFAYLWSHGIRVVPRPRYQDIVNNIGLYEYVKGKKILSKKIFQTHVGALCDFLEVLHNLSKEKDSSVISNAADACLIINQYFSIIDRRLTEFHNIGYVDQQVKELFMFIQNEFLTTASIIREEIERLAKANHVLLHKPLVKKQQTLSPSDIGFHNILLRDGQLMFVDFEYFGWDDPAKMVADLFHHPRAMIKPEYRQYIVKRVYRFLGRDQDFLKRLPFTYLLSGLNWSLIMLNVFHKRGHEDKKKAQLAKSKRKLNELLEEWHRNVYPLTLQ